jgi:hypothetical protein
LKWIELSGEDRDNVKAKAEAKAKEKKRVGRRR